MQTILLISPYWKERHRWMVSSVKLAELWQRLGFRIVVACMGAPTREESPSPTLTIATKRDLFVPDPWNYGIAPGFGGFARRLVSREKPGVIVVNKLLFWTSLAAIGLRLRGHPVLVLTDALVGMTWWPRGRLPRIAAAIYAWTLGWFVLLCATRVVFFHPQPPRLLRFLGIAGKAQVIPTGIDAAAFPAAGERAGPEVTVTYVGRLESVKGVDDFLAALAPLRAHHPRLRLRVIGWYKEGHPLVARYRDLVEFTGLRDDIGAILRSSDIFVLPSHSEGLSNALMEAMASGCACVATDVGGNRFLIDSGTAGFLFPPGDRAALRAHVERLLDDPAKRRTLGRAARQRIEEHFSWDAVGRRYAELLRNWPPA